MATNDTTPTGFRTALELRKDADTLHYCEDCEDWTPHDMDDDGRYVCRGTHE